MCLLAPGQLGAERVESLFPGSTQVRDPGLDGIERGGVDGVQAAGAAWPEAGEPVVSQHPEMLRDGRLRDPELATDDVRDLACRAFACGEQFEDSTSRGDPEHVESFHRSNCFSSDLYK